MRSFWSRRSTRQSLQFNPGGVKWVLDLNPDIKEWLEVLGCRRLIEASCQLLALSPLCIPQAVGQTLASGTMQTAEPLELKEGSNSYGTFLVKCKWEWWCNESVWICVNRRAASHWLACALFTRQAPYPINTAARWICIHLRQIAGTQARRQIISITDVVPGERQRFLPGWLRSAVSISAETFYNPCRVFNEHIFFF